MKQVLVLLCALSFGATAAFAAPMIEMKGQSEQVFVLKHADPVKGAAFVRVNDETRLRDLVGQGYEIVMRKDEAGRIQPVVADTVPEDIAKTESARAAQEANERGFTDILDMGIGLNIGFLPGAKARIVATLGPGVVAGVDLDLGTLVLLTDYSISAIVGYDFQAGRHHFRPYVTVGGGHALVFALIAAESGDIYHVGAGAEWKPAKWFGLGFEGGINVFHVERSSNIFTGTNEEDSQDLQYGYLRLTLMFYFI